MKHKFMTLLMVASLSFMTACSNNEASSPRPDQVQYQIYELAVENGFKGSYEEWLESLKGTDGENGKSAYELYKLVHPDYTGTLEEWLNSLNGKDGQDGINGTNGKSAYELYCESHPDYKGDVNQWLDDLVNDRLAKVNLHTVTFDSNGGSNVEPQEVKELYKVKKPLDPTKDGYIFDGWYIDDDKWVFNGYSVTSDMTLKAHWIKDYDSINKQVNVLSLDDIKDKDISIDLWSPFANETNEALNTIISDFELLYPNISVKVTSLGGMNQLKSKIDNSDKYHLPDLTFSYADVASAYNDRALLLPLDEFMNSSDPNVGINETSINVRADFKDISYVENASSYNNKLYGLPFCYSQNAIIYNKTIFDEFNLTFPETWQDIPTVANELFTNLKPLLGTKYTTKTGKTLDFTKVNEKDLYFMMNDDSSSLFRKINYDFGGKYVSFDKDEPKVNFLNEEAKTGLYYISDLAKDNYLGIPSEINQSYSSEAFKKMNVMAKFASPVDSKFALPNNAEFDIGVAPVPYFKDSLKTRKSVNFNGTNINMFDYNSDEEKLASWLLVRYLCCYHDEANQIDPNAKFATLTKYLPIRNTAMKNKDYSDFLKTNSVSAIISRTIINTYDESWFNMPTLSYMNNDEFRKCQEKIIYDIFVLNKSINESFNEARIVLKKYL